MRTTVISRALDTSPSTREPIFRATTSEIAFAAPCDRTQLLELLDGYLHALRSGDAQRVPCAPRMRVTEDGIDTAMGVGLWRAMPGLGAFRHCTADVERGEIGCLTTLDFAGEPALLSLRLKIEARRICEAESWLTLRGQAALFAPENLDPALASVEQRLPDALRNTRTELRVIVDGYFDAIEASDGSNVSLDPECRRFQNGVPSTVTASTFAGLSHIQRVDRRYCAIDEERGLVWGIFAFQVPGDENHAPRTTFVCESFQITAGRIRMITAFSRNMPYGTSSGW